jgi:hypothetical protein
MSHKPELKKKYSVPDKPVQTHAEQPNIIASFFQERPWMYIILLFAMISIIYFPVAFQKQYPPASDTIQWQGAAHKLIEYNKTHSDQALWTPNMFSGMPGYLISLPNKYPFIENITKATDYVMNWRIFMLFLGGLGMFFLLRILGLDGFTAFFGAVAFVFSSHWTGLLDIGHNTKYRAIMWIPWVMYGIIYLRSKPNLLGLGLASVFLIAQLRENHPQISYYLYMLIGMYWVYEVIETIQSKDWKKFLIFTLLLFIAFVFMGLAVMNPNLSTWEYGHYTIRGGSTGLDTAYAQGWSFHPLELITFLIPDFFGGTNQTYWGWMEFTQINNYSGILIFGLALLALAGRRKRLAGFLWISSLIFVSMSFGRHWAWFSNLLLNYLPFFNKFRVPSMILTVVQFNLAVLAAIGLATVVDKAKADDKVFSKQFQTWFIVVAILFVLFLVMGKGVFKGLPFTTAQEIEQLKANGQFDQLAQIKAMRLGMLYKSGALSLLFLAGGFGLILLYIRRKMAKAVFLILILLIAFIDLWIYTSKNLQGVEPASNNADYFAKRDYDEYLLSDQSNYRIYPLNVGMPGKWAYHHQTIQGYHGAKLKRYQEVLENCLDAQLRQQKINWNLLNMLNTKYVLFQDSIPFPNLQPVFTSSEEELIVHRNLTALPRAWFVDNLKELKDPKQIWATINSPEFNPALTAIVEKPVKGVESSSLREVKPLSFDLQNLSFETNTDKPAFLAISEVYYPAGWKAYIDGKETEMYPTNYILRGVVMPAGKHKLEMKFAPESYRMSTLLSLIGILLSIASLVGGFLLMRKAPKAV